MSIPTAATRARQAARRTYDLRRFDALANGAKPRRPLCLIYGNCQAEPIRALLVASAEFADGYEAVRIPAVHEISASQMASLRTVLRMASLIVAQPIEDGYRGLPLGTQEVIALARRDCAVIRFPSLHYDALYPLQVVVRAGDRLGVSAPRTVYHDLRTLCAAAKGLSIDAATRWVSQYRPPEAALRAAVEQAAATMRQRQSATDIRILDWIIASPQAHARSFFTVNHPARFVLERIAYSIHDILGFAHAGEMRGDEEPLGVFRTPLEQPVIDALGLASESSSDWIIRGRRVPTSAVVRRHLNWYRRRPDVVQAGLREYADRIDAFDLLH